MATSQNILERAAKNPPKGYAQTSISEQGQHAASAITPSTSSANTSYIEGDLRNLAQNNSPAEKKKETQSALEVVLYSMLKHHNFIVHQGQLYVYKEAEGYWQLLPNTSSQMELRSLTPQDVKRHAMKVNYPSLYEWLINEADHVSPDFFQEDRRYVNFLDCCYNLESQKTHTDREKRGFTYSLQINFPTGKPTGAYKSFVDSIFKDDDATKIEFCKFLTLLVINSRSYKYCFFLIGPSNSGKSTVLNALRYLFGPHYSSVSFSQFASEFALCELLTSRVNLSAEISSSTNKRLDIMKTITGSDGYTVSRKGQQHFRVDSNQATLVFASNVLPSFSDRTEVSSFLSRAVFFPFMISVDREDWNPNLLKELNEDTAGFLELVEIGWAALHKCGFMIEESSSMQLFKNEVSGLWDSFSTFAKKYIKKDPDGKLTSSEIQEAYETYCNHHDYTCLKPSQWSRILKLNMLCHSSTKVIKNGEDGSSRVRAYKGIAFKKSVSDLLEKEQVHNNNAPSPEQLKELFPNNA